MKVFEEITALIREHSLVFLILTLQIIFTAATSVVANTLHNDVSTENVYIETNKDYHYYSVLDILINEDEQTFLSKPDHITRLKILLSMIHNDESIEFFERYENPIHIFDEDIPDIFLRGYESGNNSRNRFWAEGHVVSNVKCVWMGDNVWEEFGISFESGRKWEKDEEDSEIIPVVLGNAYKDIYEIGDMFEGLTPTRYTDENTTFKVCGILEKDAVMIGRFDYINLDRYMLIPLPDKQALPLAPNENDEQYTIFICKLNGLVKTKLSANEVQFLMNELCKKVEFYPPLFVRGATDIENHMVVLTSSEMLDIADRLSLILIIMTLFCAITGIILFIEKKRRYLSILQLNGYSQTECSLIIFGVLVVSLIIGNVIGLMLGAFVSYLIFGISNISVVWITVTDCLVLGAALITTRIKISRQDNIRQINADN